jgi:hypothetical protein
MFSMLISGVQHSCSVKLFDEKQVSQFRAGSDETSMRRLCSGELKQNYVQIITN